MRNICRTCLPNSQITKISIFMVGKLPLQLQIQNKSNKKGDLPFNMCTLTDVGLALDGSQVYTPESLWIAFCTSNRLVVRTPFSVTKEMPPRGESKLIVCNKIDLTFHFFFVVISSFLRVI